MTPNYLVQDADTKVSGSNISLTQGETKNVRLFLLNPDGSPLFFTGSVSAIVAKIFSAVGSPSIQKTLAASQIAAIADPTLGMFGFTFQLLPADTTAMAVNSSGLPILITVTFADGTVREFNFLAVFLVNGIAVTT